MHDEHQDPDRPDETGRVRFGGGMQQGGGMVEPDEFEEGGTDVLDETPDRTQAPTTSEGADPPR